MDNPQPILRGLLICAVTAAGCFAMAVQVAAADLSAQAAVSSRSVFVGEPFRFQIQVSGSESPDQPDLSTLSDFNVQFEGGNSNSRQSVTVINGQVSRNVQHGYVFNYRLIPKRPGRLTIPSITVNAEGQTAQTQPLQIAARKPAESDQFKLRQSLSKTRVYVGEPVVLEVVFYYSADVQNPNINVPLLNRDEFQFSDLEDKSGQRVEQLDGKTYQTSRVRKVVIPQEAGEYSIPSATLTFQGVVGHQTGRDLFNRPVRKPRYKRFAIPSNELSLEVLEIPVEGRPDNFTGLIGQYQISATASPTNVNVGDPIKLNIALSGPPALEHVELPPLNAQDNLARHFKIPIGRDPGKVVGNSKKFTRTLRALNETVDEIPPIELPYFDTEKGAYEVARSHPIPLRVKATRVVTAKDAEGDSPVIGQTSEVQSWTQGIAYNYEGPEVIRDRPLGPMAWIRSPGWLATLVTPPLAYFALFTLVTVQRRRMADPDALRARKALAELNARLDSAAGTDDVLQALRNFLGAKLRRPSSALTFKDVKPLLERKGIDDETSASVKALFDECEASRYAGGGERKPGQLAERCREIARKLEGLFQ